MPKKRVTSKRVSRKTVAKKHDPLNTPLIRVVVTFVIGASIMLLFYNLFAK